MADRDIARREADLDRDQAEWRLKLADLEDRKEKLTAELKILIPRATEKRRIVAELEKSITALKATKDATAAEIEAQQGELKAVKASIALELDKLNDLLAKIEAKKAKVDKTVEDYETAKRQEAEGRLQKLKTDEQTLKSSLNNLRNEISGLIEQKTEADGKLAEARQVIADTDKEIANIKEVITGLKDRKNRLMADIAGLEGQKTEALKELADIRGQVEEFKTYEAKAWAALRVKDEALVAKAKELEVRAQFSHNSTSFLPPRE